MKDTEVIKLIGGMAKANAFAETVANECGVKVCHYIDEEKPDYNFLYVRFEYENFRKFCVAYDKIEEWLKVYGLYLTYECCGDGDGIIESYRIR